jgi:hypothetical protein
MRMTIQLSSVEGQPIRRFATVCDAAFKAPLAGYGFRPVRGTLAHPKVARRIYRAGDRYVGVSATTHPMDAPAHCTLAVGEGSHEFPDADWNAIALWQLAAEGHAPPPVEEPYRLPDIGQLPSVLQLMNADLLRLAADFLAGDLRHFRAVRAGVAAARMPYRIWSPAPGGGYSPTEDPKSAALRTRYAAEGTRDADEES